MLRRAHCMFVALYGTYLTFDGLVRAVARELLHRRSSLISSSLSGSKYKFVLHKAGWRFARGEGGHGLAIDLSFPSSWGMSGTSYRVRRSMYAIA